jgi:hypothetical protein
LRNQLVQLLMVLVCIGLLSYFLRDPLIPGSQSVDGIRLGEARAQVESRLGGHGTPVDYFETGNSTGWKTERQKVFFGNHPEEAEKAGPPMLQGLAYGNEKSYLLPLVGYNPEGRVEWVCGCVLSGNGREFKGQALSSLGSGESCFRAGYCMAGPCGWRFMNCQLSVAGGGEGIGSPALPHWTVLLLTPGPLTQRLQREQNEWAAQQAKWQKELQERR